MTPSLQNQERQSTKSAAQSTTHFCPVPCPHPGPVIKTTKQIITTDPKNKSYKKDPKWGHYCIISVAQLGQLWVHCPHAGERGRGLNTATLTKLGTTRVMITILGPGCWAGVLGAVAAGPVSMLHSVPDSSQLSLSSECSKKR